MIYFLFFAVIVIGIYFFVMYSNHHVELTEYVYNGAPKDFDGYRILHVSDLHGDFTKRKYKNILKQTFDLKPDMIVVTGDSIDNIHIKNKDMVIEYFKIVNDNFQLYYVSGNHEYMHPECEEVMHDIERIGVKMLHNASIHIYNGKDSLILYGVDDPYSFYNGKLPLKYETPKDKFDNLILNLKGNAATEYNSISILLSHRPEFFAAYVKAGFDIVFSGHAHGGQWRLPFFKGVIAPDQGIHPQYSEGAYMEKKTTMYVSRGLGNSIFPFRFFNNPELVVVILKYNELKGEDNDAI